MNRFEQKAAIVTGGSSGIGASVAAALAQEGASVAVVASSDIGKAEIVAARIRAEGGQAEAFAAKVNLPAEVTSLFDAVVGRFGKIDIVVNAAGLFMPSPLDGTDISVSDAMIDTNFKGTWNMIQGATPHLKRNGGGKILNFASVAGLTGFKGFSLYSATKAAIVMLTKVAAAELAPFNINVNAIAPGNTETPMNDGLRNDPAFASILDEMRKMTPSNTVFSKPNEIAQAALFLLSPMARPIYGTTLLADEGISAAIG